MRRERDMGGLFTLEAMSLLNTVFAKAESVLLARNLKSYKQRISSSFIICNRRTYSQEQVVIKISALCVLLVLILDSPSLNQVNCLKKKAGQQVPTTRKSRLIDTIPFPYEYIYIK